MSKSKELKSGLANVFRLTRNTKDSGKISLKPTKPTATPSKVALTRYVANSEGIIPLSTSTLLSGLLSKENFLYPSEKEQVPSFALAVDALLFRKNYSELEEIKVKFFHRL